MGKNKIFQIAQILMIKLPYNEQFTWAELGSSHIVKTSH